MEIDPKGRSSQEVVQLWSYISDRLEKNFRRTVFSVPAATSQQVSAARPNGGFGRRVVG
jgi:chromosome partitioning protein